MSNNKEFPWVPDIKAGAEEKQKVKELRDRTRAAYGVPVTIEVTAGRVLLLPIMEAEDEKESLILLDENIRKEMKSQTLHRAIVKSVGNKGQQFTEGEVVYVYPNQFEATISLNGVGYLIYQERSIIAKDTTPFDLSVILN